MNLFGSKKDDKVRVRCPECSAKLKFPPGKPGLIIRCPVCASSVVSPLEDSEAAERIEEAKARAQEPAAAASPGEGAKAYRRKSASGGKLVDKLQSWEAQRAQQASNDSIHRLVGFLNRENDRVRDAAIPVIHDPEMPRDQRQRRLQSLRQDKSVRVRNEIDKILHALEDEIHALTHHPTPGQASVRTQREEKTAEKRGFLRFLKHIYGLRLANTDKDRLHLTE